MTFDALVQLGPEFILLLGGCAALLLGSTVVSRHFQCVSPFSLMVVVAALAATWALGTPEPGVVVPGLWLTPLSHYVRWITLSVGALIVLVNWHQPAATQRGEYMALILFSLLGILLTAAANDLVVLFFAIELVSVPTYVLIALSRLDGRASEAAVKYFFLGALSAAVLAFGLSYLYGATGTTTLHMPGSGAAALSGVFDAPTGPHALIGLLLVFAGLAFKVAAVPMHLYVGDVYEGAASPVTGLLGFVPKIAGFVALVKIFAACQWDLPAAVHWLVWIVAAATMTVGNVLALHQQNVKRMLAYSSVAHTGYMLIALLVGPVAGRGPMHDGVAALLFYIAVYGAMNLGVFAVLTAFRAPGVAGERRRDAETLDDLAGLSRRAPAAAAALAIFAFSLMGFPPTAGFVGKLYIFGSAFSLDDSHAFSTPLIVLAVIGVVNAAIAAAYYLRIIAAAYLRDEESTLTARAGGPVRWGMALCAIPVLALFVWPSGLVDEARRGAVTAGTPSVAHRVAVDTGHTDVDADRPGMSVDSPGHGNFSP